MEPSAKGPTSYLIDICTNFAIVLQGIASGDRGLGLAPCLIASNFSIFEYGSGAEGGGGRFGPLRARSLWLVLRLTVLRRATRLTRRCFCSCYRRRIGRDLRSAQFRERSARDARRSIRAHAVRERPPLRQSTHPNHLRHIPRPTFKPAKSGKPASSRGAWNQSILAFRGRSAQHHLRKNTARYWHHQRAGSANTRLVQQPQMIRSAISQFCA